MRQVKITEAAQQDLRAIGEYVARYNVELNFCKRREERAKFEHSR